MGLDGELNRLHTGINNLDSKIDARFDAVIAKIEETKNNQSNLVTTAESNWKTGLLAAFALLTSGKIHWMDLVHMIFR